MSDFNTSPKTNTRDMSTQQPACDRCRGQKLRCSRNQKSQASCNRCERAGAVCVVDSSIRMGRPSRNRAHHQESRRERRKHQSTSSESSENPSAINMPQGTEEDTAWDHDRNPSNAFLANGSMTTQYDGTADLDVSTYQQDLSFLNEGSGCDGWSTFAADHGFEEEPTFDPCQAESNQVATDQVCSLAHGPMQNLRRKSVIIGKLGWGMNTGSLQSSISAHQTSVERLSTLNLELYQQYSTTGALMDERAATCACSCETGTEANLPSLIANMLQGLQKFQELLFEILSSHAEICSASSTNLYHLAQGPATAAPQNTSTSSRPNINFRHSNTTSVERGFPTSVSSGQRHHQQPLNNIPATPCTNQLNLPTSLLTISCYINLVHVCRKVLVAIRCCLLFHDRESIFSAQLSDFQISGVSLQQDPNLQVLVIIQVVIRFLDRIGRPLGCPYNDKSGVGPRDEDVLEGNAISPHLLQVVLREEMNFHGVRVQGIEAIKEEIRKLNEIINNDN